MKISLYILFLFFSVTAFSQKNDEIRLMANTRSLHQAVFVSKDSMALDKLFSEKLSYGHSGGKIENKLEALNGIVNNRSVYEQLTSGTTSVWLNDKTAVTRYSMSADERTKEGKVSSLKLHIMLVWAKEKKDWKLMARQAVKIN